MNLMQLIVGLTIGVLLMVGLVSPVVADGQTTAGDETTLTNNSPIVLREVVPGDVLKGVRTVTDDVANDTWTLNDEPVLGPAGDADRWNVGVMSDGFYLQMNAPANSALGVWYNMTLSNPSIQYLSGGGASGATHTITFSENTITLQSGTSTPITFNYSWAYVVCPYGEGEYCAPIAGGVGLVENPDQVILCGAYTSGDLDTMYYYKDGQTYVSNTAYTMTANITTAVHTGTTDIYDATVSVAMTDGTNTETFTPYRILVPYEVTGHEAGGANYALLKAIPIVAFIALIAFAAFAVRGRMND